MDTDEMGHTRVFSWAHLLVRDLRTRYGINPIYVYRWGAKAQGMREKTGNGHDVSAELEHFIEDLKAVVRDGQALLKAGVSTVKERAVAGAQGTALFESARTKPLVSRSDWAWSWD